MNRTPPHSAEAEAGLLASMLYAPERGTVDEGIALLPGDPTVFYEEAHRILFAAIAAMHSQGMGIDLLTLTQHLKDQGNLEPAGGYAKVTGLATSVSTAANIGHYAGIVLDKYRRRQAIDAARLLAQAAADEGAPLDTPLEAHANSLLELTRIRNDDGFVALADIFAEDVEAMDAAAHSDRTYTGLDTGLEGLNEAINGFGKGELIVLAARPSMGKTALALQMAQHVAQSEGEGVAIFELEMARRPLFTRMAVSQGGNLNLHHAMRGQLVGADRGRYDRNAVRLAGLPIYIDATPGINIHHARSKARRLQRQHGIGLIVVDYLQLMTAGGNNRHEEVGRISRGLKEMAKDLNVPVLALAQLSRRVEERSDKRPQLSDLKESGDIEQDADVALFIYRPGVYGLNRADGSPYEDEAQILIAKQRNGPIGAINLVWNGPECRFEPATHLEETY